MGFLDDIKNKAGELGDKAGDAFETAKDKAGDLVEAAKDKLDRDADGTLSSADASAAFESAKAQASEVFENLKDKVTGGGDAPADAVAEAAAGGVTMSEDESPDFPEAPATEAEVSAEAAKDDALGAVQDTAEDLRSDKA